MSVKRLADDATGASMVEYALLMGLIALACIAATDSLGTGVLGWYQRAAGELHSVTVPGDAETPGGDAETPGGDAETPGGDSSGGSSGLPGNGYGWPGTGHYGGGG